MSRRILITIGNRDRPTELYGLLQSLRTQTFQDFDILIYEDASGTSIQNYYFLQYMFYRMRIEGHQIMLYRNDVSQGVSKMRQACIDLGRKHFPHCELIARIDDDSILESNYLEKLLEVIDAGYDIASGVVPTFPAVDVRNNIDNVKPIIGYCELNNNGELIANFDDCGVMYNDEVILPSPHFRSCALMKASIFDKVDYGNRLTKNGFREEQVFSFKAILAGFKIGCHTGAIAWHLNTPSGGERDTMNLGALNQKIFDETVKKMFEDNGDFLKDYYKRLRVKPRKLSNIELASQFNLVGNKPIPMMEDIIKNGK